ncbi:MAG: pyruvate dehydrogenase complex dihydrolipoamide acetyltransferase [Pseudorhodoplanes sp.]|nr:MAG: pyruvate dehydrogenase complex dihydrolipoamide acetyltransferase [Pseudorhodoplanes sp.]
MNEHPDAAARRDSGRRQDHQMVQGRGRGGGARRPPVRDRDRQDLDGGAGDERRPAYRNPRAGRRRCAGRGGGRGDRRRCGGTGAGGWRRSRAGCDAIFAAGAGVQGERALGSRLRGNERNSGTPAAGSPMELFSEVRTPERNFGPARIAGGIVVTPLARRLASERGIDLSRVTGSGPHGRIVAADVESHAPAPGPAIAGGAGAAQVAALYRDVPFSEVPLDAMRRTIAARLIEAKQTVPHFYLSADIEIGRLLAAHEEANAAARDGHGAPALRLSLTDFIVKAWALALVRVPAANAVWAGDRILRFARADIGVAVALEGGLVTPVLRQADSKPVSAIAAEMRDLAARARAKKLKPEEYQGGSSAISNLGMHGVREFAAIINPPHATILAVGAARRAPVETADGGIRFASQMTVTLSCDHRVVDGALGAELLAAFKRLIEAPVTMLV